MAGAGTPSSEEGPQWGTVSQEGTGDGKGDPTGSGWGKVAPCKLVSVARMEDKTSLIQGSCAQDSAQTPMD